MRFKKILWLLPFIFLFVACEDDQSDPVVPDVDSEENKKVNDWTYASMDYYYLWREAMPTSVDDIKTQDPKYFFDRLLYYYSNVQYDRWSLIVSDYDEWIKELEGRSAATGANLGFFSFSGTTQVFAVVYYVDKDSPADKQGLKRGDAILEVNGTVPTTQNYIDLFFGEGTHEYTMGKIEGSVVEETGVKLTVTPEEFQKDPILMYKVFEKEGKKVGYLCYTSFLHDFNDALSTVFADFKAQQIDELILDLRYNSGGSGSSAIRLASLIAPSSVKSKIFFKKTWNANRNVEIDELIKQDPTQYRTLKEEIFEDAPENLNLTKVHIITTGWSASASELVIAGLKPYMDVELIGGNTHGKFTGSITIDDETKSHNWAIQPIIFKYENADGFTDFWDGIAVNVSADDDFSYELGDEQENLLNIALSRAVGVVAKKRSTLPYSIENIGYENNLRLKGGILIDESVEKIISK